MRLHELAEPVFQYVCRLNRLGRCATAGGGSETSFFSKSGAAPKGLSLDYAVVRAQVKALMEDFIRGAAADQRLASQAKKVELPMLFFIDSMIAESKLPFAAQWNENRLAYERDELAGDEKFFDLLEETIKDSSDEASERLTIFYTCLGLGFTGIFFNQPEYLRKSLLTIAPRIRHLMDTEQSGRICPEAYEGVDTRDLIQPPSSRVALLSIVFACFILAVLASYFLMYQTEKKRIAQSMEEIVNKDLNATVNAN